MEVPDGGHVSLFCGHDQMHLRHSITCDIVPLSCKSATLAFGDEGFSQLRTGGEVRSVSDIFRLLLVRDDDVGYVVFQDEQMMEPRDFLNKHRARHLPLALGGRQVGVGVFVSERSQVDGLHVWWGLSLLWVAAAAKEGRAGEWIANWPRHWSRRLERLGFLPPHLRPSLRGKNGNGESSPRGSSDAVGVRCLAEKAASTPAMLILLARLAKQRSTDKKCNDSAMSWRSLLRGICSTTPRRPSRSS